MPGKQVWCTHCNERREETRTVRDQSRERWHEANVQSHGFGSECCRRVMRRRHHSSPAPAAAEPPSRREQLLLRNEAVLASLLRAIIPSTDTESYGFFLVALPQLLPLSHRGASTGAMEAMEAPWNLRCVHGSSVE